MNTSGENKSTGHTFEISSKQSNFTKQGSTIGTNTMNTMVEAKKQQSNNKNNKE